MKTAVSIPDDLFDEADKLARRLKKKRSELYASALREYLAKHSPEYVTETLDSVYAEGTPEMDHVRAAARRVLERTEWR